MLELLLIVLIPLLFVGVLVVTSVRRGRELRLLCEDGVEVEGRIVALQKFKGKGPRARFVRYEYRDASGQLHTHRGAVSASEWDASQVGDPVRIIHSASRPAVSARADLVLQARQALASGRMVTQVK